MAQDSPASAEEELDARLDALIDAGVVLEDDDADELTLSEAFADVYERHARQFLRLDDERFRTAVAETFDIDTDEAAVRIEEFGATRTDLAIYRALRSFLDDPPPQEELAACADMVAVLVSEPVVPPSLEKLDDEDYEDFVRDRGDVVLIVLKEGCGSCRVLKDDLPEIITRAPAEVSFAGIDGDDAPALRAAFEVTAAPTTLVFADGEWAAKIRGRKPADEFVTRLEHIYS